MKLFTRLLVLPGILIALATPLTTWSFEYNSPEHIRGAKTIDAEGLADIAQSSPSLLIVDARMAMDHAKGYIEGSVNLVDSDTNCDSLGELAPQIDTPMVFYCNGVNCDRSDIAVKIARDCGYRRLYWFRGGVEEWQAKRFPLVK
ncbi:MAG: rhodanese-like domain-containing protein [Pseudomonadota bacterium]|nr:rhodanese-like domain-containing protein [Pseudomonadota bacterium]